MALSIKPQLPSYYGGEDSPELKRLVGATIVAIGTPALGRRRFEGGGFAIRYQPRGAEETHAIVFEFNELGLRIAQETGPDSA